MAIKGKKKTRGSQARRRPGGAPRPQVYVPPHQPWYRTAGGRVAVAIGLVLVLALIGGLVAKTRGDAVERERRQEAVEDYTEDIRRLSQEVATAATGVTAAPVAPEGEVFEALTKDSTRWIEAFEGAVSATFELRPPDDLAGSLDVFRQALNLYATTARSYGFAAQLEGKDAEKALARAAEVRDRAIGVWAAASSVLDGVRLDIGLGPASIPPPADPMAAPPVPEEGPALNEGGDASVEDGNDSGDGSGTGERKGRKTGGERNRKS